MKRITIIIFGLIIALIALLLAFKAERNDNVQSTLDPTDGYTIAASIK